MAYEYYGTNAMKKILQNIKTELDKHVLSAGGESGATVVTFTEATDRANIASGDTVATIAGKVAKYFTDLENGGFNVDVSASTPAFTEATTRANIATGETLAVMLGKISKYFTDLSDVAFSGSYNDLSDTPDLSVYLKSEDAAKTYVAIADMTELTETKAQELWDSVFAAAPAEG